MALSTPRPPRTTSLGTATRRHRGRARRRRLLLLVAFVVLCVIIAKLAAPTIRRVAGTTSDATALDPTLFATGACVAYQPTAGKDRHTTVFLDAGHGGLDPGALGTTGSGQGVTEASITLPMELDTMALLRADGYRVVVSRTTDSTVLRLGPADESGGELSLLGAHDDVAARDQCANAAGAQVLVGIYMDAGGSSDNAGCLTAYDTARPFVARNQELATLVNNDVLADLNANGWQIPDIGPTNDSTVGSLAGNPADGGLAAEAAAYGHLLLLGPADPGYFSTPSTMPGTVVEPLFITDPFEADIAVSTAGQQAVAHGVAQAVEQFLSPNSGTTTTAG